MDAKVANVLRKMSSARRDVMALYAEAMCSAQILERELVQVLYFLRIGSGELKEQAFNWGVPANDPKEAKRAAGLDSR